MNDADKEAFAAGKYPPTTHAKAVDTIPAIAKRYPLDTRPSERKVDSSENDELTIRGLREQLDSAERDRDHWKARADKFEAEVGRLNKELAYEKQRADDNWREYINMRLSKEPGR